MLPLYLLGWVYNHQHLSYIIVAAEKAQAHISQPAVENGCALFGGPRKAGTTKRFLIADCSGENKPTSLLPVLGKFAARTKEEFQIGTNQDSPVSLQPY